MQMAHHFLDHVEMDIDEALDFEPLRAVFPEFRGARLVGGVFVDWDG